MEAVIEMYIDYNERKPSTRTLRYAFHSRVLKTKKKKNVSRTYRLPTARSAFRFISFSLHPTPHRRHY
jgi:hypothetical protein